MIQKYRILDYMEPLSQKQRRVLDAIHAHCLERGYPPTIRELAARLSIVSLNCIRVHLKTLQGKGYLALDRRSSRGIRLLDRSSPSLLGEIIELPIAGRIIAGLPEEAIQEIEGKLPLPKELVGGAGNAFLLRVKGVSMEPELHEGDLVIVRPQPTAETGEMVVALVDGEATVKLYHPFGSRMILKALNPDYPPIEVSSELAISGKVIGLIRKF